MSLDSSSLGASQTSVYIGVQTGPSPGSVNGAEVVDGQVQDSTSSASFKGSVSLGLYKNLPNAPSLQNPNQTLVNQDLFSPSPLQTPLSMITQGNQETPLPTPQEIDQAYDQAFEKIIAKDPDANAERLAHYTSPTGTPSTPAEKAAMAEVLSKLPASLQDFVPTANKDDFEMKLNLSYDDEFKSLLQNQKPPLSKGEIAKLKQMHYSQGGAKTGSAQTGKTSSENQALQTKLQSLETEAKSVTAQKYGIPLNSDGEPSIDFEANSSMYEASLNGFYQKNLDTETTSFLNSAQGVNLSSSDQNTLQILVSGQQVPNAPKNLVDQANSIIAAAIAGVQQNILGGAAFTPVSSVAYPKTNPVIQGVINTLSSIVKQGSNIVNAFPSTGSSGATKSSYESILKEISAALTDFEEAVYSSEGTTAQQAQQSSISKLDIALGQIKKHAAAIKKADAEQAKMNSLGIFAKIFMIIAVIIVAIIAAIMIVCSFGTLTPVAVAMMQGMFAATASVFAGSTTAIAASAGALTASEVAIEAGITAGLEAGVAAADAGATAGGASGATAAETMVESMVEAAAEAEVETVVAANAAATTSGTAGSASGAAGSAASSGGAGASSGAGGADAVLDAAVDAEEDIVDAAVSSTTDSSTGSDTLDALADSLTRTYNLFKADIQTQDSLFLGIVEDTGEGISGVSDVASGSMTIGQSRMQANLAIMQANMNASQTMADADIAVIEKLIKQLEALLAGQTDVINYTSGIVNNLDKSTSQAITGITSA